MNQIWLAFITGITTGGISCMAVQGGLLASSITKENKYRTVSLFLIAKILAYTALGFALGALGSKLILSPTLQGWMQILVGIFMIGTAGRLLNIHPIFRYFAITPPKFIYRFVRRESKVGSSFTPVILGLTTILIPCGVTQAMMALAITSGSAAIGAGILFAFTLGTSPVFFGLGAVASHLMKNKKFVYASAFVIFIIGILSINTGQVLRGSPHTLQNYASAVGSFFSSSKAAGASVARVVGGKQEVTINVNNSGYTSQVNTLKAGVPVKLNLVSNNVQSCARSFLIPSMGISKILPQDGTTTIEFTPTSTGTLRYTCGMGMYTGQFNIES